MAQMMPKGGAVHTIRRKWLVTGITDDDVKEQSLDMETIENLINQADIVIAHNESFDRPMLEKRFAQFEVKPWGCSINSINWQEEGISSAKLDYILFKLGKFYEGALSH